MTDPTITAEQLAELPRNARAEARAAREALGAAYPEPAATAYGPHVFTILELGDRTSAPYCAVCGLEEEGAEHVPDRAEAAATAPALPAPLDRIDLDGHRWDDMRTAAPQVRQALIDALRAQAADLRANRGTVVVPEDTYDLVRRLTAAGEVLRQWRDAFEAVAKEADAMLEEEALTAMGSYPGVEDAPSGSLFVPDGEGHRIAVTPDWKPGESTWDLDTLEAWVAEQVIADEGLGLETDRPVFTAQEAMSLVRDGMDKLLRLCGKVTPAASKVEAERKRLAGLGRDTDAAVLRQVRSVGNRRYMGVKITREAGK